MRRTGLDRPLPPTRTTRFSSLQFAPSVDESLCSPQIPSTVSFSDVCMAGCLPVDRHITVHLSSFFLVPSKSLRALDFFGRAIQGQISTSICPRLGNKNLSTLTTRDATQSSTTKKSRRKSPPDTLVSEWVGYILRITGGNNEQGFPMKQGVLLPYCVKLLLLDSHSCYRPRRTGERKRKFDEGEIVGLTDDVLPKRVNKIQRPFNLSKEDVAAGDHQGRRRARSRVPSPKIQRPVAPIRLQCPRHLKSLIRRRTEHQKEQKAEFEMNLAPGNVFLSPTMWSDEIFIEALSDALIQRTRPALYDQLDVVTTVTDQRLKAESTAAIREWASADLADDSDSDSEDEFKVSVTPTCLQQGHAPPSCAELRDMCTKVIAETAVVCEQRDALVAENSALIAENSALKAENLKMKIQKALHEKAIMDTKCTEEGEESSPDREPVQDFEACIFPVLTQLVSDAQPTLRHAGTLRTDDGPCKTCTGESKHHVGY
ncbi:ribosomal protein S6e-domain-containing protein [Mycena olivaceomarginata]|nr:ribosomal protein S6e-domain-containing protein [Mycena olivaceomarginata]